MDYFSIPWQTVSTNCTAYGRGHIWFGDSYGFVHRVDRGLHITSFQAHDSCVHLMHQMKEHDLLITIGVSSHEKLVLHTTFSLLLWKSTLLILTVKIYFAISVIWRFTFVFKTAICFIEYQKAIINDVVFLTKYFTGLSKFQPLFHFLSYTFESVS